jgi:uncharacterized repeat protein (TIGR03803 family)
VCLIQATNGNFYGTTSVDGANGNGTIFKVTQRGRLTTLYSFCSQSNCTDGAYPVAALIQATNGNFYGTTLYGGSMYGGSTGLGTVFKVNATGELKTLHTFCAQEYCPEGAYSAAALIQDTNGKVYGTTSSSGANGVGTVFSLSAGLGPFVETNPTSGKVGTAVKILGMRSNTDLGRPERRGSAESTQSGYAELVPMKGTCQPS